MKKKLKITLTLLVLVVLGYFGYTHFKKTSILLNVIHKDAESVIKIGVHDITKTLVLDAFSSPSYYWKNTKFFKKDKEKDTIKNDGKGVDLRPYSIVLYTIKNIDNTFFATFKIDDTDAFKTYISKYSKEKSSAIKTDKNGYKHLVLEKSKLVLAWNSKRLAVALTTGASLEKLKTVFKDVLIDEKLISDKDHNLIKKLSTNTEHITYVDKESLIALNFKDNKAVLNGTVFKKNTDTYKTNTTYSNFTNPSLHLFFDGNFNHTENKNTFIKRLEKSSFLTKNNIEVAQLVENTSGFLSIGINGTTIQTDTIVSYQYDDNFEKVPVKTLQEKSVPKISINLGTNDDKSLKNYLIKQGAITNNVLTSVPYYIFYAEENSNVTSFKTTKDTEAKEEKNSSNFFEANVNFNRLKNDVSIPGTDEIFELLEVLKLEANQIKGTNQIKIKGNLSAKEEDINIISQLFFGLKERAAKDNSEN